MRPAGARLAVRWRRNSYDRARRHQVQGRCAEIDSDLGAAQRHVGQFLQLIGAVDGRTRWSPDK